jgi:hypothetical protein
MRCVFVYYSVMAVARTSCDGMQHLEPYGTPIKPLREKLCDEHEAATLLGLSVATLRRWRWAKRGPAWIKIGSAVRYAPRDIAAFVEAGRQSTQDMLGEVDAAEPVSVG